MATPEWVSELGVAGTLVIAIAAIWGDKIRGTLFGPKLRLALVDNVGELTTQVVQRGQAALQFIPARYYHVRVRNPRSYPATEVQILLTRLDVRRPDGKPQKMHTGALPLGWKFQAPHPETRTIGRATVADADLFFVCPDFLQLTPIILPFNLSAMMQGEVHIWLTLVARGLECESKPLRLRIDWDGKWERGDTEMGRHLTIAPIASAQS